MALWNKFPQTHAARVSHAACLRIRKQCQELCWPGVDGLNGKERRGRKRTRGLQPNKVFSPQVFLWLHLEWAGCVSVQVTVRGLGSQVEAGRLHKEHVCQEHSHTLSLHGQKVQGSTVRD